MTPHLANARILASTALWLAILSFAGVAAHPPVSSEIERVTRELEQGLEARLLLARAELHRIAGRLDLAAEDAEAALRLAPDLAEAHLCLSRVALERGDPTDAEREARLCLARAPSAADGYRALSRALGKSGAVREAAAAQREAIELASPPDPADYLDLARLASNPGGGGPDAALDALDAGMAILGPLPALQARAIEIAKRAGRFDAALARIDELLPASPRRETWLAERGRILLAAGRVPEAWAAFSDALQAVEALPEHHRDTIAIRRLEAELLSRLQHPEEESGP